PACRGTRTRHASAPPCMRDAGTCGPSVDRDPSTIHPRPGRAVGIRHRPRARGERPRDHEFAPLEAVGPRHDDRPPDEQREQAHLQRRERGGPPRMPIEEDREARRDERCAGDVSPRRMGRQPGGYQRRGEADIAEMPDAEGNQGEPVKNPRDASAPLADRKVRMRAAAIRALGCVERRGTRDINQRFPCARPRILRNRRAHHRRRVENHEPQGEVTDEGAGGDGGDARPEDARPAAEGYECAQIDDELSRRKGLRYRLPYRSEIRLEEAEDPQGDEGPGEECVTRARDARRTIRGHWGSFYRHSQVSPRCPPIPRSGKRATTRTPEVKPFSYLKVSRAGPHAVMLPLRPFPKGIGEPRMYTPNPDFEALATVPVAEVVPVGKVGH